MPIQDKLLAAEGAVADTASTIIAADEEAELLAEEAKEEAKKEDEAKAEPSLKAAEVVTAETAPNPSGETVVNEEDERATTANAKAVSRHAFLTKQRNALKARLGRSA